MSTIYQRKGWKRTLASWIYNKVCCKLWGHANGQRMTDDQAKYYAEGQLLGGRMVMVKYITDTGREIHRLCLIIEKRNRKIRALRLALEQSRQNVPTLAHADENQPNQK